MNVGCGRARITPGLGVSMAGYFEDRFATSVHDELYAKALVFESGGVRAAIVSCDVICIQDDTVASIRAQVESRTGIAGDNVMVAATHTHTGPRTRMARLHAGDDVTSAWLDGFPSLVADAVAIAADDVEPCQASVGIAQEDRIAFNRRFHMADGSVRTNPGSRNADIVRPAGPIDPKVTAVAFKTARGGNKALLVNYACHLDNVGGTRLSADFPGYLAARLEERLEDAPFGVFLNGACGDINHIDVNSAVRRKGHEHARWMGETLASDVCEALRGADALPTTPVRVGVATASLPTTEDAEADPTTDVQAIALGDLAVVGVPAEYFVELQLDIQQRSPFPVTVVSELTNGWIGYVPTRKAFEENMGHVTAARMDGFDHMGYEVRSALSRGYLPGVGEAIADAAAAVLERLRG
jgi:neutral ceramidase